jgi:tRNA-specific 2-thiouridylase
MFAEYAAGRTPNPDVLCNREIKFNVFLKTALSLGADYVATGHYCQKEIETDSDGKNIYRLLSGADGNKDQSYFLCQLTQEQLEKTLFPIGNLQKKEVRKIALDQDLVTADKKDSQGLCFIGKVRLPEFLQQQLKPKTGQIIEIPRSHYETPASNNELSLEELSFKRRYQRGDGKVKGTHQGAHFFTIGQRKGLAVGGTSDPLFVVDTDVDENIVFVGQGKEHPGLFRKALKVTEAATHWVRPDLKLEAGETLAVMAQIRYRQSLEKACLHATEKFLYVVFDNKQSAITSGQFVAWYSGDELIGSGVIS